MDQTITPNPGNNQQQVDSLLNDILNGKSAVTSDDSSPAMTAPVDPITGVDPTTPVASAAMPKGDDAVMGTGLHALLEDVKGTEEKMEVKSPVAANMMSTDKAPVDTMSDDKMMTDKMPMDKPPMVSPPPVMPSMSMPNVPEPTVTPTMPPAPAVTPTSPKFASVTSDSTMPASTMPKYQPAAAPVPGKKGPMIAAVAIGLVVLAGVGAGVVLSQQNADTRNQAFVQPAQQTAQQVIQQTAGQNTANVPAAGAPPVDTNAIMVLPSAKNGFIALQGQYPNATAVSLTGDTAGTAYVADDASTGTKQFFFKVSGAGMTSGKTLVVWVTSGDTSSVLTTLSVDDDGSAYGSGYAPVGVTSGSIDISLENTSADGVYPAPTQKVSHGEF